MVNCSIPAFLLIIISLLAKPVSAAEPHQIVKKGVADLRTTNLKLTTISLNGEWAFTWNKLVEPSGEMAFKNYTLFPGLWNGNKVNDQELTAQGFASYHCTILLPVNRGPLAIRLPDLYSSYSLYINGSFFTGNGSPATTPAGYTPQWLPKTLVLPAHADTLQLLLQIANFSHAKGGIKKEILIGDYDQLQFQRDKWIATDFLLAGCLFMGGLFFFGLYLFGKNDKATLYFSLFSMVYSYRIVGSNFYALHSMFPNLPWELTTRLEYFTLFSSIFLFLQYVCALYPKDIYKPITRLLGAFCFVVSITPLLTPPLFFTRIINPFLGLMFFCIAYVLFVFVKAFFCKRAGSNYALISIAVFMIVMFIINLEYFGFFIPAREVIFFGYILFFFLQSLILSFRFAHTLQQAKDQAVEGLRAKSEFLSTMSHEIRTPLNSVIGMTHLLLKNNPRKDQREQLDVLLFSGGNLLSIVNNILDYSKIEAGKIAFEHIEMDIAHILHHIVSGAKNSVVEKGIRLQLCLPEQPLPNVMGDPTRLTQVISNLVGNAVKFTQYGMVTLELKIAYRDKEQISLGFYVHDTGIGISKEKQEVIFEQFTQADSTTSRGYGGTGLGLAISKKILELQGARLQVASEEGKGATFYFTQNFAITNTPMAPLIQKEKQQEDMASTSFAGLHILLVEDNPINVFVAKSFLERWGATIDVAENGQQAIHLLNPRLHKMILMDMHMPVMDGYTATRIIREKGLDIPIIALTASLPSEVAQEVTGLGIDGMVLKPFVPEDLFKVVKRFATAEVNPT